MEVARFMGSESEEQFQHNGTIPTILAKGSLRLKVLVCSGETDPAKISKLGNKVLGIGWNPPSDELVFHFNVSLVDRKEKSISIVNKHNQTNLIMVSSLPAISSALSTAYMIRLICVLQ